MFRKYAQLDPYERHKHLINEFLLKRPGDTKYLKRDDTKDKKDIDVIREHHRFLWDDSLSAADGESWEQRLAKKYYDKLFKEYTICDLQRYIENKIALRWRTEQEVVIGKGQFLCGNKICSKDAELRTWEVNFAYEEHGEKKNALVKLRLCPKCSDKLNYRTKKREIKRLNRKLKSVTKATSSGSSSQIKRSFDKKTYETETVAEKDEEEAENTEDNEVPAYSQEIQETSAHEWTKAPCIETKNREEEFDNFLEDLFF